MCGGIANLCAKNKIQAALYQCGRLAAYLVLAAVFGYLGERIQTALREHAWPIVIGYVVFGLILILSIRKFSIFSHMVAATGSKQHHFLAFGLGFSSLFLPCGWLHSVLLVCVALGSIQLAMAGILGFWIGSLPALVFAQWLRLKLHSRKPILSQLQKGVSVLLIGVSIFLIGTRINSQTKTSTENEKVHSCH